MLLPFLISFRTACRRCNEDHSSACAQMETFYKLKARKGKTLKYGIISDSTLRHVEEVGLDAHVACVSGGLIGGVVTAAADIKERPEHLILMAEQNTIDDKRRLYKTETEYRFAVHMGIA